LKSSGLFATMLNLNLDVQDAYKESSINLSTNGVVSFVGLTGPWVGTGSISCSSHMACEIASQMLLTPYTAVDEDVLDSVAEITNMVLGNVKTSLENIVGPMGISIPTVIYGRNFTSRAVGKHEWTIVPFASGGERLEVQICLLPQGQGHRPRLTLADEAVQI
jgi:chemotaxis protein CheX